MRCIETIILPSYAADMLKIKSNMRCIETILAAFLKTGRGAIKSNMRCIETGAEGSLCARHY